MCSPEQALGSSVVCYVRWFVFFYFHVCLLCLLVRFFHVCMLF